MRQKTKLFPALGTIHSITVYDYADDEMADLALNKCRDAVIDLHERWSCFSDNSEISCINHNAGIRPVKVKPDTYSIIKRACSFKELTGGAYDVHSGRLYHLWKTALRSQRIPSDKEISQNRQEGASVVPYQIAKGCQEISLTGQKSPSIDLGGIAKGYAADLTKRILQQSGIEHAVINLGGTVTVIGETQLIGIQNPFTSDKSLLGYIPLSNQSMVTSGTYEQFFKKDGRRYHHIIDPRTGYPADTGLVSVTLIGNDATMLDALATGIIVMGIKEGLPLLVQNNIDAVIVTETGTIYTTQGLKESLLPFTA